MSEHPDPPTPDGAPAGPRTFRVLVVPGVNPDRWLRVWHERLADVPLELVVVEPSEAEVRLRAGDGDVAILRLPVDRDALSAIPLYTETTVAVAPRDHVFSVADELTPADLADETVVRPDDDLVGWDDAPGEPFAGGPVATTADAVDLVAAGVGVVLLPQSVARLHHRRGLVARPVTDAPGSQVALAWVTDAHDDLTEEFIGIVRGRTAASSRGRGGAAQPGQADPRTGRGQGEQQRGGTPKAGSRKTGGQKSGGQAGGAQKGGARQPGARRSPAPPRGRRPHRGR